MNYLTSVVRLMDICESELLFGTLPVAKTQRDCIKRVWMKNSVVREDANIGVKGWVNDKPHRTDGKPAIICKHNGNRYWYVNGKLHRVGGPAIITTSGNKKWLISSKLHRIGGPAILHKAGFQYWYVNGKDHRTDGPSYVIFDKIGALYCINGQQVDEF